MNELRWILVAAGVVLIALLYVFGRRQQSDFEDEPFEDQRHTPPLDLEEADDPDPGQISSPTSEAIEVPEPRPTVVDEGSPPPESMSSPVLPEKIIALHLVPMNEDLFNGKELVDALRSESLQFGRFDIFHRFAEGEEADAESLSIFSVANLVKPGTFNFRDIDNQQIKGASMFLVLPGPDDPLAAFADMLATGRRLAATLDGRLVDGHGSQVSRQRASHMREDIINYQHGISTETSTA